MSSSSWRKRSLVVGLALVTLAIVPAPAQEPASAGSPPRLSDAAGPGADGLRRGVEQWRKGELERAERDLDRALRAEPGLGLAHFFRACVRIERGELEGAIEDATRALEAHPDWAEAHFERARARARSGRLAEAVADLDRAIELSPTYPNALVARGYLRLHAGDLDRAKSDFDAAIAQLGDYADAYVGRAEVLITRGGNGAAPRKDLDRAIEIDPRHADAYALRARVPLPSEGSRKDIDAALRIDPDHPYALTFLATLLNREGKPAEALALLERVLSKQPDTWDALFQRGVSRLRLGDTKGTIADWKRALELAPRYHGPEWREKLAERIRALERSR